MLVSIKLRAMLFLPMVVFLATTVAPAPMVSVLKSGNDHNPEKTSNGEYMFNYSVNDDDSGDYKAHRESRKGDVVEGRYEVIEPDGFKRIVTYTADAENGFVAVVRREPTDISIPTYEVRKYKPVSKNLPLKTKLNAFTDTIKVTPHIEKTLTLGENELRDVVESKLPQNHLKEQSQPRNEILNFSRSEIDVQPDKGKQLVSIDLVLRPEKQNDLEIQDIAYSENLGLVKLMSQINAALTAVPSGNNNSLNQLQRATVDTLSTMGVAPIFLNNTDNEPVTQSHREVFLDTNEKEDKSDVSSRDINMGNPGGLNKKPVQIEATSLSQTNVHNTERLEPEIQEQQTKQETSGNSSAVDSSSDQTLVDPEIGEKNESENQGTGNQDKEFEDVTTEAVLETTTQAVVEEIQDVTIKTTEATEENEVNITVNGESSNEAVTTPAATFNRNIPEEAKLLTDQSNNSATETDDVTTIAYDENEEVTQLSLTTIDTYNETTSLRSVETATYLNLEDERDDPTTVASDELLPTIKNTEPKFEEKVTTPGTQTNATGVNFEAETNLITMMPKETEMLTSADGEFTTSNVKLAEVTNNKTSPHVTIPATTIGHLPVSNNNENTKQIHKIIQISPKIILIKSLST